MNYPLTVKDEAAIKDLVSIMLNSIMKTEEARELVIRSHPLKIVNTSKTFDEFVDRIGEATVTYLKTVSLMPTHEAANKRIRNLLPKLRITKDKLFI